METLEICHADNFPARLESDDSMATKEERMATLESNMQSITADVKQMKTDVGEIKTGLARLQGSIGILKTILTLAAPAMIGWMGWLSYQVIFQAGVASSKIVAELKSPKSPQQLQATLSTVVAQIQTADAAGKKPDAKKVELLSGALSKVVRENPELPEAWRAVASLVSYRSVNAVNIATPMPDCDVSQAPRMIADSEIPEIPPSSYGRKGYLFRNCRLHMDHLPPGALIRTQPAAVSPGSPIQVGDTISIGWTAFIIDCDVILNDSGIQASNIEVFSFAHCRLEYHIEKTPPPTAQRLLMASLAQTADGRIALDFGT